MTLVLGAWLDWDGTTALHQLQDWHVQCSLADVEVLMLARGFAVVACIGMAGLAPPQRTLSTRARSSSDKGGTKRAEYRTPGGAPWRRAACAVSVVALGLLVAKAALWRGDAPSCTAPEVGRGDLSLGRAALGLALALTVLDAAALWHQAVAGGTARVCGGTTGGPARRTAASPLLGGKRNASINTGAGGAAGAGAGAVAGVRARQPGNDKGGATFARMARLAKPEVPILVLGSMALIVSTATTLSIPSYIGHIINLVTTSKSMSELNSTVITLVIVLAVNAVATTIRGTLFTLAGERVVRSPEVACGTTSRHD